MMIYKTTGAEPVLNAFLAELRIQVLIADRAYEGLFNQHLYIQGDRKVKTCSPIKAMTDCALFLNSAAMINKILGLSNRYENDRAQKLRTMMELEEKKLCDLRLVDLRNSMEHMDERLDLLENENISELVIWDLTESHSKEKHILRKFNPQDFTMQCLGKNLGTHTLDVKKCYKEIQYVRSAIEVGASKILSKKWDC